MKKVFANTSVEVAQRSEMVSTLYATEKALQEIEMTTWRQCPHCLDTGIKHTANGEDDYDQEYCDCVKGQKLEKDDEWKNYKDSPLYQFRYMLGK